MKYKKLSDKKLGEELLRIIFEKRKVQKGKNLEELEKERLLILKEMRRRYPQNYLGK